MIRTEDMKTDLPNLKFFVGGLALASAVALSPSVFAATSYDCMIEPTQTVELRSTVSGLIERIDVKRGDRVKTGQVLVTLESSVERAAAEAARYKAEMTGPEEVASTKHLFAKRKFERRRDMHAERLMSGQDRDDAEGEMKSAAAELQLAEENHDVAVLDSTQQDALLKRRTLRSPFDGVVADQFSVCRRGCGAGQRAETDSETGSARPTSRARDSAA